LERGGWLVSEVNGPRGWRGGAVSESPRRLWDKRSLEAPMGESFETSKRREGIRVSRLEPLKLSAPLKGAWLRDMADSQIVQAIS